MSRRHHQSNHHVPVAPPRVPLGVNVQLYTQRVPTAIGPAGELVGGGVMQVLQLADETGTLMVRFGLPGHVRTRLAAELAKPLSAIDLPAGVDTDPELVDLVPDAPPPDLDGGEG